MNKFYITSAIPYVNAAPHIGHALEFLQTDILARLARLENKDTIFLTGADENSLKNVQAAQAQNIPTQTLCDQNSLLFENLINKLNISVDIFQKASDKKHIEGSQLLWQLCDKSGDIYKRTYQGLYCVGCEAFYNKDELTEDGLCPEHLKKPELIKEENYFFRLSKYQSFLEDLIKNDKLKITPEIRKNEVFAFIKKGLKDFSISRSAKRAHNWGIPVPNDPDQVIYVWFDALNIYQTGIGFGSDQAKYQKYHPADIHIIGKGISRFHAIFWPAILKSAGLKIPKNIFIHGYVTIEGQKMSKTLGNVINPTSLIEKYGVDSLRYYLAREIPTYQDGDFSQNRFIQLYNADLANGLGNLIARVASLCQKSNLDFPQSNDSYSLRDNLQKLISQFKLNEAISTLWLDKNNSVTYLDRLINDQKPWRQQGKDLEKTLFQSVSIIRHIAYNLQLFLPTTAQKILTQFKGSKIITSPPLFPRLDND